MTRLFVVALFLVGLSAMSYFLFLHKPGVNGQEKRTEFASDRFPAPIPAKPIAIDGARAMGYLKAICDIGPRISGTDGMTKQQQLITKHFEGLGAKVKRQTFEGKQRSRPTAVEMTNLIVSYHPEKTKRVILCSHYDTRPLADQESNPRLWRQPFVSANDGGSGVAFLMELAHHMKDLPLQVGVDFVIFDGEEWIFDKDVDVYFLGSKHFAQSWRTNRKDRPDYAAAILLDMIAGKNASFPVEGYSNEKAPGLVRQIWQTAFEIDCTAFRNRQGDYVQDDHTALLEVGIPAIDIIDFSYPHWHKLTDTPENCHPEGMIQVGKVLTTWLQRLR